MHPREIQRENDKIKQQKLDEARREYWEGTFEGVKKVLDKKLEGPVRVKKRFQYIFHRLITWEGYRVTKIAIIDEFDVTERTVQRDIEGFFKFFHLVTVSQQGYAPTKKFFWLVDRLKKIDPEKYGFST